MLETCNSPNLLYPLNLPLVKKGKSVSPFEASCPSIVAYNIHKYIVCVYVYKGRKRKSLYYTIESVCVCSGYIVFIPRDRVVSGASVLYAWRQHVDSTRPSNSLYALFILTQSNTRDTPTIYTLLHPVDKRLGEKISLISFQNLVIYLLFTFFLFFFSVATENTDFWFICFFRGTAFVLRVVGRAVFCCLWRLFYLRLFGLYVYTRLIVCFRVVFIYSGTE